MGREVWRMMVLLLSLTSGGCMFHGLHLQQALIDDSCQLSGTVHSTSTRPVVLNLYALGPEGDEDAVLVEQQLQEHASGWRFVTGPGRYRVLAFQDSGNDQRWSGQEPWGGIRGREVLECRRGSRFVDLRIDLQGAQPAAATRELLQNEVPSARLLSLGAALSKGELSRLDNPLWAPPYGQMGLWQPVDFIKQAHPGIQFLQPYRADKTPVLFIHGIGGTPRNFERLIQALPAERLQPWLAYYPSGADLDAVVWMLDSIVQELQVRYGFRRLLVVAHSMGGLVARGLVLSLQDGGSAVQVPALVTLATPWAGDSRAALGVRHAPAVISSWRNLAPDSDFLRLLFQRPDGSRRPLPALTHHYLLFAYQRTPLTLAEPGDGRIALSSQLRDEAQQQAYRIRAYQQSHMGILHAPPVFDEVARILDAYATPCTGAAQACKASSQSR